MGFTKVFADLVRRKERAEQEATARLEPVESGKDQRVLGSAHHRTGTGEKDTVCCGI